MGKPYNVTLEESYDENIKALRTFNGTSSVTSLSAAAAISNGTPLTATGLKLFTVQVVKTGTATVAVEGSCDGGTTYSTITYNGTTLSDVNGIITFEGVYDAVRCSVTAYTGGTVDAYIKGSY